jgi:hypothetical protein
MTIEILGSRLSLAIEGCLVDDGVGLDMFSVKLPSGKKVHVIVVADKHEPILSKAVEDVISFNKSQRRNLQNEWQRKLNHD